MRRQTREVRGPAILPEPPHEKPVIETQEIYRGYRITLGSDDGSRWWARIEDLDVEIMPMPTLQQALAGAAAFVDGMERATH